MTNKSFLKSHINLILIVIIIILLILLLISYRKNAVLKSTNNTDIFEIIIKNCESGESEKQVFNEDNLSNNIIIEDAETSENDDNENNNQKELNIFSNPAYDKKSIIAPGSSNAYKFVVRNKNNFNIQYSIKMKEFNKYNINIKYRLKQKGSYIVGNDDTWVNADELIIEKTKLKSKGSMPYTLEWKWFDSDSDTEIGKISKENYKLTIQVEAKSI